MAIGKTPASPSPAIRHAPAIAGSLDAPSTKQQAIPASTRPARSKRNSVISCSTPGTIRRPSRRPVHKKDGIKAHASLRDDCNRWAYVALHPDKELSVPMYRKKSKLSPNGKGSRTILPRGEFETTEIISAGSGNPLSGVDIAKASASRAAAMANTATKRVICRVRSPTATSKGAAIAPRVQEQFTKLRALARRDGLASLTHKFVAPALKPMPTP